MGGTGLILGAGCLDDRTGGDDDDGDGDDADPSGSTDLSPPARWIPTDLGAKLLFTYADLETVRAHETELRPDTLDEVSFLPRGAGGRVVGRLENEPTFEYVLEFGPERAGGYHVMGGEFDLSGLDVGEPVDEIGGFEVYDAAGASVAASSDTLVVVDPDVGRIDDVLATGLDGTDRRSNADDAFGTVLDHVRPGTLTFGFAPESVDGGGITLGQTWSIDTETTTFTQVLVSDAVAELDEDELKAEMTGDSSDDRFETFSVDIDGETAIGSGTVPTAEFQYVDSLSKTQVGVSGTVSATVTIEVETAVQTVTVALAALDSAGHVEVRDGGGTRATLTERGDEATLEYDVGDSETVTVVGVRGEQESVIATERVEF